MPPYARAYDPLTLEALEDYRTGHREWRTDYLGDQAYPTARYLAARCREIGASVPEGRNAQRWYRIADCWDRWAYELSAGTAWETYDEEWSSAPFHTQLPQAVYVEIIRNGHDEGDLTGMYQTFTAMDDDAYGNWIRNIAVHAALMRSPNLDMERHGHLLTTGPGTPGWEQRYGAPPAKGAAND